MPAIRRKYRQIGTATPDSEKLMPQKPLTDDQKTLCARCGEPKWKHEPQRMWQPDHEFTTVWKPDFFRPEQKS